ncbi:MAG: hypothetical protein JNK54_08705 [Elusimicrobia bacterium]|jgi:hypothetical protein|nr:hypothetical protein [Elusimicrobiota bacterium]
MKLWVYASVVFLGVGLMGCNRNMGSRLTEGRAGSEAAVAPTSVEEAVTKGVAESVGALISQDLAAKATAMVDCSTGTRTATFQWVDVPPSVYGSTRTYTFNGVQYTTSFQSRSTGGRLRFSNHYNGTCLTFSNYDTGKLKYETELTSIGSNGDGYVSYQESTYTYWSTGIAYVVHYNWGQITNGKVFGDTRTYTGFIKYAS